MFATSDATPDAPEFSVKRQTCQVGPPLTPKFDVGTPPLGGETLGDRLTQAMKRSKLKNPDVAKVLGVHETTVSRWRSDAQMPEERQIEALAQLITTKGVPVSARWLRYGSSARTVEPHTASNGGAPMSAVRVVASPRVLGWLYRFRADLIELGATEDQAENLSDGLKQIVRSPAVGGAHQEWTEDDAIAAMEPEAEDIKKTFAKLKRR